MKILLLTLYLFLWSLHSSFIPNVGNNFSIYDLPFNHFAGTKMEIKINKLIKEAHWQAKWVIK